MARSAVRRANAYALKLDPATTALRITARSADMKAEAGAAAGVASDLDDKTRAVLGGASAAVGSLLIPAYLAFSRKLGAIVRKHNGKTATAEAALIGAVFLGRGLVDVVLEAIALDVYGITIDLTP